MAVSRSIEDEPRGVYCGAIGLVGPADAPVRARFSVAIRTAVVDTASGAAVHGTGGGITWSSEAAAEHAEVLAKAAVLSCRPEEFELLETSRREPYDRRRRRPDVDDVVLVNERGEVTEATTAALAVRLRSEEHT